MLQTLFTGPKRLVPDARQHFAALQEAAELYPERLKDHGGSAYLRRKPFDDRQGHPDFFGGMFAVMNALKAMHLPHASRIVEVGSGPGWLTELLLGLGHSVVAVEPSQAMHDAATQRIAMLAQRLGTAGVPEYRQVTATLEEWDMSGVAGTADAVMFHEAFHHVIDEVETAERCFALLQPGGLVSITGDSRWQPGNAEQERFFTDESDRYGTLESPFTKDYLHHVLDRAGFAPITFFHGVNGWFPVGQEDVTVRAASDANADELNNVIAQRPHGDGQAFLLHPEQAALDYRVVAAERRGDDVMLTVTVHNTGGVALPSPRTQPRGGVWFALVQARPDGAPGAETPQRLQLANTLPQGGSVELTLAFPTGGVPGPYTLKAVAEAVCWLPGGAPIDA